MNADNTSMKAPILSLLGLSLLAATTAFGEQQPSRATDAPAQAEAPKLTKFNLDFPGGTPGELVAAIQKATGRPLNAIIPTEFAGQKLPPLKMNGVDVAELFHALTASSRKQERIGRQYFDAELGFRTESNLSDQSVWYFYVRKPDITAEKSCRFYLLTPYLEQGLTVDDITTAIQTGWKMLGDSGAQPASMSFHKETKLLIAVGESSQLETIVAVLGALRVPPPPAKEPSH